jgi:hypothetical protein
MWYYRKKEKVTYEEKYRHFKNSLLSGIPERIPLNRDE